MFVGCGCHCKEDSVSISNFPSRFSVSGRFLSVSSISGSLPSDYEPPYERPVEDCVACRDAVAPIQYDVFWDYNGAPATGFYDNKECCGAYNAVKTIRVKRIASPRPGFILEQNCVWVSDVPALSSRMDFTGSFIPQRGCDTVFSGPPFNVFNPRVTISIPGEPIPGILGINDPWVAIQYQHEIKLLNGQLLPQPSAFYAFYFYSPENGENWREVGVRCLQPMRFRLHSPFGPIVKRWANTFFESRWGGGVWYGAPCKQSAFGGFDMGLPDFVTVTPVAA